MIGGGLLSGFGPRRARRGAAVATDSVRDLDQARILRALTGRQRYRCVQPRVEREGEGWKVVSPNCSRNIDASGGEIDIAWLVRGPSSGWALHARDHAQQRWRLTANGLPLAEALALLCADADRMYWP